MYVSSESVYLAHLTTPLANIEMTEAVQKLGWVGEGTRFDVYVTYSSLIHSYIYMFIYIYTFYRNYFYFCRLPIVIQMPGEQAKVFSIPQEDVLVIQINHPRYEWFAHFDLQWFAIPLVSSILITPSLLSFFI